MKLTVFENCVLCFYGTLLRKFISMHYESNFVLLNRPSRKKFLELIYVAVNSLISTNWIIKKYSWLVKWAIFLLWYQDIFFFSIFKNKSAVDVCKIIMYLLVIFILLLNFHSNLSLFFSFLPSLAHWYLLKKYSLEQKVMEFI